MNGCSWGITWSSALCVCESEASSIFTVWNSYFLNTAIRLATLDLPNFCLDPISTPLSVSVPLHVRPKSTRILEETTSFKLLYALKTPELRTPSRLRLKPYLPFAKHWLHSPVPAHGIMQNLQTRLNVSIPTIKSQTAIFENWGYAHTSRVPCRAGVYAPHYSRLVLEDRLALERDPVAGEGAVARSEFDRNSRSQLLKFFEERAAGIGSEFGQLFVRTR